MSDSEGGTPPTHSRLSNLDVFDVIGGVSADLTMAMEIQTPCSKPEPLSRCSIGKTLMPPHECITPFMRKANLSNLDQKLLKLRTGATSVKSVCDKHAL
ncbi:tRNA N6-adenosine threonylcarbamoyltransferase [Frankliniella fusca]|uniref:tRNA N6-adenosine threonylcarbamoyltransferase n=1 Tax=Frankliniella fusca TaxID=407009 RepID=A0AAE1HFY7_9NEOP|nr:tRNA N6-adenosine threonylcarbamoyltransferase [Frankliniella fusca]